MKTNSNRILSIFMSMLMVFMCMTSASVQATVQKMTFRFNKIEVSAGQDIQFDIITPNPMAIKEVTNAVINIPDGFTVTGMSETSPAFNGTVSYTLTGQYLNFSIASNGTLGSSDVIASIYMHVNENCEKKNYMFQWTTNAVSCILANGSSYTPQFTFGIVTVGEGGSGQTTTTSAPTTTTTTTTTTQTTTTSTQTTTATTETTIMETTSCYAKVQIESYPTKLTYNIGEELDLSGGTFNVEYNVLSNTNRYDPVIVTYDMTEEDNNINIDTSEFDNTKSGTYQITITFVSDYIHGWNGYPPYESFKVNVVDLTTTSTTTTTVTTTTTTTTTAKKYTYSINFVDVETNQGVSGVKYKILNFTGNDTVKISNGERYYFESELERVLLTIENPIPEGYYLPPGTTPLEVSASNPDLTISLGKVETTTTTTETTTTTTTPPITYIPPIRTTEFMSTPSQTTPPTTTTTNTSATFIIYPLTTETSTLYIDIDSSPTKLTYYTGEELDLSGGKYTVKGSTQYSQIKEYTLDMADTSANPEHITSVIDTSEFDNTKAGNYTIYIKVDAFSMHTETSFNVTVTDNTEILNLGDVDNDGFVNAIDASIVSIEYALLSTGDHIGQFTPEQNTIADLNKDGQINAVDASLIAMYYAYLSTDNEIGTKDSIDIWLVNLEKSSVLSNETETQTTTTTIYIPPVTTTTTTTTDNSFNINNYPLYKTRLKEIGTAIQNDSFDSSFSPVYEYDSKKGYILQDLNSDGTPELIITADDKYSDNQTIIEVYSIYRNQLVKLCQSETRLSYSLCENNVISNGGGLGPSISGIGYYKYTFGDSLDNIGYLSCEYTDNGVIWTYKDTQISEKEANAIQNQYKAIKVESIPLDNTYDAGTFSSDNTWHDTQGYIDGGTWDNATGDNTWNSDLVGVFDRDAGDGYGYYDVYGNYYPYAKYQ